MSQPARTASGGEPLELTDSRLRAQNLRDAFVAMKLMPAPRDTNGQEDGEEGDDAEHDRVAELAFSRDTPEGAANAAAVAASVAAATTDVPAEAESVADGAPALRLLPDTDSDFEDDYSGDEVGADADADDEDEDTPEPGLYTSVQLGYADPPSHALALRRDFFPSKVGGRPAWLNPSPAALPPTAALQCSRCARPMTLLAQLYAPLSHLPAAFHRSLYLFACQHGSCLAAAPTEAVRAFRCSLPRTNDFYSTAAPAPPATAKAAAAAAAAGTSTTAATAPAGASAPAAAAGAASLTADVLPFAGAPLCVVCGAPADAALSSSGRHFCSHAHARADALAPAAAAGAAAARALVVLPSFEVNTEEECLPTYSQQVKISQAKGDLAPGAPAGVSTSDASGDAASAAATAAAAASGDAKIAAMAGDYARARAAMTEEERAAVDRVFADSKGAAKGAQAKGSEAKGAEPAEDAELEAAVAEEVRAKQAVLASKRNDQVHVAFQARVDCNPEQVLRYVPYSKRAAAVHSAEETGAAGTSTARPLWVGQRRRLARAPDCPCCGGARDLEFQVMPQLLYFLEREAAQMKARAAKDKVAIDASTLNGLLRTDDALDFGTIAVYTCRNNCGGGSDGTGYVQEFAYAQPPQA